MSEEIPRLTPRESARSARTPRAKTDVLVSTTTDAPAAPAAVVDGAGPRPSTGRLGAGIGALMLAFALVYFVLGRRRPPAGS